MPLLVLNNGCDSLSQVRVEMYVESSSCKRVFRNTVRACLCLTRSALKNTSLRTVLSALRTSPIVNPATSLTRIPAPTVSKSIRRLRSAYVRCAMYCKTCSSSAGVKDFAVAKLFSK